MTVLHEETTPYSQFRIVQKGRRLDMEVKGAVFAVYHPQRLLSGYSWDALTAAAVLSPYVRVRRLLMLGVAAGTALRQMRHLWPKAELVGIEIDRQLTKGAQKWMGLAEVDAQLIFGDADKQIKRLQGPFDVIIDDLYKCGVSDVERGGAPFENRLTHLKELLAPKGLIAANFINDLGFEAPLQAGEQAFCSHFPKVACIEATYGLNQVFLGGKSLAAPKALAKKGSMWLDVADRALWKTLKVTGIKNYP